MQIGDFVMTDHPASTPREVVRTYGIVQKMSKKDGVTIEMADGSRIRRRFNAIAVYVQPPANWDELYEKQQIVLCKRKQPVISNRMQFRQRHN